MHVAKSKPWSNLLWRVFATQQQRQWCCMHIKLTGRVRALFSHQTMSVRIIYRETSFITSGKSYIPLIRRQKATPMILGWIISKEGAATPQKYELFLWGILGVDDSAYMPWLECFYFLLLNSNGSELFTMGCGGKLWTDGHSGFLLFS